MGKLKGKNALVTGTSQGIGTAISRALIGEGCNICMHYYHSKAEPEKLQEAAHGMGQQAVCIGANLTSEQDVSALISGAVEKLGSFDILVNNSGSLVERRALDDVDLDFWYRVIDINMTTMMLVTRKMLPHFNATGGASIINNSSLAGRKGGHHGSLVYSAAKGAVLAWTRALSQELAPKGIRVNAVAPGFIEGTSFHETHTSRELARKTIDQIPLGRSGAPDDVARAVLFLASEYDGFITGETIDINGGVYCA